MDAEIRMMIAAALQRRIDEIKEDYRMERQGMLMTRKETAELLRVSTRTVRRWEAEGILRPRKIAGSIRHRRSEVLALLENGGQAQ